MPKFRVNSILGKDFRRNGVTFTGSPVDIDTDELHWTPEQVENLRSAGGEKAQGAALSVIEIDDGGKPVKAKAKAGTPAEAVAAANAAGVSLPGHPTAEEADAASKGKRGR